MVTFEEAAAMLDEAADSLPEEIFDKLNGGVNLLPAGARTSTGCWSWECTSWTRWAATSRYITAHSRSALPPRRPSAGSVSSQRRSSTSLRTTSRTWPTTGAWSAGTPEHVAWLLSGLEDEPLEAESVLFVDADGSGLAAMAAAMFAQAAKDANCPELRGAAASGGRVRLRPGPQSSPRRGEVRPRHLRHRAPPRRPSPAREL